MHLLVRDRYSRLFELSDIHPWSSIKAVKDGVAQYFHVSPAKQRIFFAGRELKNHRTIIDYAIPDGAALFLAVQGESDSLALISVYGDVPCSERFRERVLIPADGGLASGLKPKLSIEGTGGTYFLRNRQKKNIAVFKAEDEEPFAPNNPRGYIGHFGSSTFRRGVLSGEGAAREVAAYLLDSIGFFSVPATTRVEIDCRAFEHSQPEAKQVLGGLNFAISNQLSLINLPSAPSSLADSLKRSPSLDFPSGQFQSRRSKVGALQEFVEFDDFAGDVAPQSLPAKEVQKIAVLDIRMFNLDRNEANILIVKRYETTAAQTPLDVTPSPSPSPALGFTIASSSPQALALDPAQPLPASHSPPLPPAAPAGMSRLQARLAALKSAKSSKPSIHLIPIDHSLTLPDTLELNWTDWCWIDWPQVKQPIDDEIKQFVLSIDPKSDMELLRSRLTIREECLLVMRISCLLLKKGVERDLTLYQIGSLMCRANLDSPSDLEILCSQATLLAKAKLEAAKLAASSSSRRNSTIRMRSDDDLNELSLRRSVSHHDFRDCQVNENGFQLSELLSKGKRAAAQLSAAAALPHSHSHSLLNGGLADMLEFSSLAQSFPEEQQIDTFLGCLAHLIDSAIDRLIAKEKIKQSNEANQNSNNHTIESRSLLSIAESGPSLSPGPSDHSPTIFQQLLTPTAAPDYRFGIGLANAEKPTAEV